MLQCGLLFVSICLSLFSTSGDDCSSKIRIVDVGDRSIATVERVCNQDHGLSTHAIGLTNGDFSDGLNGWIVDEKGGVSAPGSVGVVEEEAELLEGDSFLVTLEQAFTMPSGGGRLWFRFEAEPGFDRADISIPDAFEVSLLDDDRSSVLPTWHVDATSFFNVQEDGSHFEGDGATFDGEWVRVDVSGVIAGASVTLYVDLIGADGDLASGVHVDDFFFEPDCTAAARTEVFGDGWPGELGVPDLSTDDSPQLCSSLRLNLGNSSGIQTVGCLMLGSQRTDLPTRWGGHLLVEMELEWPFPLPPQGVSITSPMPCTATACGLDVHLQWVVIDPGASKGVAFSRGLTLGLGGQ